MAVIVGKLVRKRRFISSCDGLKPFCKGVDRYVSIAKYGSSDFFNRALTVFTALSASPFDWGNFGLLVVCKNPYSSVNFLYSSEEYYGPLSDIISLGMPCLTKIDLV